MGYVRFDFSKINITPATVATLATVQGKQVEVSQPSQLSRAVIHKAEIRLLTSADDRLAFLTIDGGIPAAYTDAFLTLQAAPPEGAPEANWRQTIDDAGRFLDRWGTTAAALGWPATDLFEFIPTGCSGLAWELQGREVIALTADEAILSPNDRTERTWFCRPISAN